MRGGDSGQQGSVLVLAAAMSLLLIGFVGLAVDGGEIQAQQRQSQNAADGAALAAATAVINADNYAYTTTDATNIAIAVAGFAGIDAADVTVTYKDGAGSVTSVPTSVATVTATGEPRISAMDGHFLHGTWSFSTSGTAAKAHHLRARPSVSVAHVDNEELAVFSHGRVEEAAAGDADWEETIGHWTAHYGGSPLEWGPDIRLYRFVPHWMVGYAWKRAELLAKRGLAPTSP